MSITSRSYRFFKCCSQIRLIFSTASADFAVDPLTYKRKTYFAWRELEPGRSNSPANPGFRFPAGLLSFGGLFIQAFLSGSVCLSQIQPHQQNMNTLSGADGWETPLVTAVDLCGTSPRCPETGL